MPAPRAPDATTQRAQSSQDCVGERSSRFSQAFRTAALARRAFAAGTSSTARVAAPPVRRCGTPHDLLAHWRPFKSMKRGRAANRPFKPLRAFPRSGGRFFALIFTLRQINGQRNAQQKMHLHYTKTESANRCNLVEIGKLRWIVGVAARHAGQSQEVHWEKSDIE